MSLNIFHALLSDSLKTLVSLVKIIKLFKEEVVV